MKRINFIKEWKYIYSEIHKGRPKEDFSINIIRAREILLCAQVFLFKADKSFNEKDYRELNFYTELYFVSMKHYFKLILNE